jgi:ribosomal protein S18 acetylase RimI-like enzyme
VEFVSALVIPFHEKFLEEVNEIFFESSTRKDFKDEQDKEFFFQKYLGHYLVHYPEFCWVALEDKVLGYIVASPNSTDEILHSLQPHLAIFNNYFAQYPAHLHINCHAESRGKGIGSLLMNKVIEQMTLKKIRGLHIMTGPDSKNIEFYRKLGFVFETIEKFQGSSILFMSKALSDN